MSEKLIANSIKNLLEIYKKDTSHYKEISSIFMNLSELTLDQDVRSFCIDASVVIGEAVYEKLTDINFEELEEEFNRLIQSHL